MKYAFLGFIVLSSLILTTWDNSAVARATLPNGEPLTGDALTVYREVNEELSVRKGAQLSKTMNYDDCFDDSYWVCADLGPCQVKLSKLGPKIKVPSFGIEFKYWEPNAIVETVCSEGNSYYADDMNISGRIMGKSRIMGEETKINGVPAEKCIETIRTGGGMEGSGATPRYFNEVHVWGIGIVPRFLSSANVIEATVSSICGYGGLIGGLFKVFDGLSGDPDAASGLGDSIDAATGTLDTVAPWIEDAAWAADKFDKFSSGDYVGGMLGVAGIELSKGWTAAANIGMNALLSSKEKAKEEVRSEDLCKERKFVEESKMRSDDAMALLVNPDKDVTMFTGTKVSEGVCPLGVYRGHTLAYDDRSFRGVKKVPFWPNMCGPYDNYKDSNCSQFGGDTSILISQIEINGLFPACNGYPVSGQVVKPVYKVTVSGKDDGPRRLIGYSATGGVTYENTNGWGNGSASVDTTDMILPSAVNCSLVGNYKDAVTVCKTNGAYNEAFDHQKMLNEYMQNTIEGSFGETQIEATETLEELDSRIADLGGDCDSEGNPEGVWGTAVIQAAVVLAATDGMEAAQTYLRESPAYESLKRETDLIQKMTQKRIEELSATYLDPAKKYIAEQKEKAQKYLKDLFKDEAEEALGEGAEEEAKEYVEDIVKEYIPIDYIEDSIKEFLPDIDLSLGGADGGVDFGEAMNYANTAMDIYKAATFDGALKQAAVGMASRMDPTGLWPAFMSEISAQSWRGEDVPAAMKIRGMIGTVGHLPCAVGALADDFSLDIAGSGSILTATEDWFGCVGTWGPTEPQNGFVYHRDGMIAAGLAGYRAYKLAVSLMTISEHPTAAAGAPMRINMDFPHGSKCYTPGTADLRWESKNGWDINKASADLLTGSYDYLLEPFKAIGDSYDKIFDEDGNRTSESKVMETAQEGHVFTYWKKTKCCLYLIEYYGSWDACWEVEREY